MGATWPFIEKTKDGDACLFHSKNCMNFSFRRETIGVDKGPKKVFD